MPKLKIHLSQINTIVGDLDGNCSKILNEFQKASDAKCDLAIFPEMAICGYPCEDLWLKPYFIAAINDKISEICQASLNSKCAILLGSPSSILNRKKEEIIYNSAILIEDGEIKNTINKKTLPNSHTFDERRYFTPDNTLSLIEFRGLTLAILICEDLWDAKNLFLLQEQVLDAVISINASPYSTKKHENRLKISEKFVKNLKKPLIYLNQIGGQDALVFDGSSFVLDESGEKICQFEEFIEDSEIVILEKNNSDVDCKTDDKNQPSKEFDVNYSNYSACVLGLRDYVQKNGFEKIILGMSGGIDSAIVALIAVDALGFENVSLYALPSRYNSEESLVDAQQCAANLNVELDIIHIEETFEALKNTLKNSGNEASGLTAENLQSRIRGNILMALSNNSGALLLSTGNKSELAVGYATIYGDMCGAFNPIKDLYKTQIYKLANWRNNNLSKIGLHKSKNPIPQNIITKEPTAELRENQKDSDSLPDYETLDKILIATIEDKKSIEELVELGFEESLVKEVVKLFYNSEYKRQQSCLGPKISEMSFDKDRRYPLTNKFIK